MLSPEIIELILEISQEENLKILYNSIGANASVNHLHLHIMKLDFGLLEFPIERTQLEPLFG